jgi:hypothetical protein
MKAVCATLFCSAALVTALAGQAPLEKPGDAHAAAGTSQINPILDGVFLKTDWHAVKNPFRIEDQGTTAEAPDRSEQMEVVGLAKMPDEGGILRTYAFVNKTSAARPQPAEGKGGKPVRGAEAEPRTQQETQVLQAFPEILDEKTTPTEEQAENSSIMLINEQLWFIGAVAISNKMTAVFWPYGAYPVREETLQLYDLEDPMLKDLAIRRTKAGEKIGGEKGVNVLARVAKAKLIREQHSQENHPSAGNGPPAKPTLFPPPPAVHKSGNVTKDVQRALQGQP